MDPSRRGRSKRKAFFFEKKKQKTFIPWGRCQMIKSFLLLFVKKEGLSCSACSLRGITPGDNRHKPEAGVALVEVSTDDGATWSDAVLEKQSGFARQRFKSEWRPEAGRYQLLCRCTDARGVQQPRHGSRNAIHKIQVTVG